MFHNMVNHLCPFLFRLSFYFNFHDILEQNKFKKVDSLETEGQSIEEAIEEKEEESIETAVDEA